MSDPRFTRLHTDPRFRRPKKNTQKVVVDERFKAVFDDDSNTNKKSGKRKSKGGRVDKYGRQVADTHEKDNLRRFYRLDGQNDEEEHEDAQTPQIIDYARGQVLLESSDEEDDEESAKGDGESEDGDDGNVILGQHASKPIPVLAEDDEYLEVDLNEDEDGDAYADLDAQAASYANEHAKDDEPEQGGVKTNRLAVVNLDWDHVRASHLYKIFSSLVSPTAPSASASVAVKGATSVSVRGNEKASSAAKIVRGKILSARVYPSEFGKERLKKEEVEGPPKEIFKKSRRRDEDDTLSSLIQEDEGDEYDEKALRKYQLERLRYFYAIATCDTVEAAAHLVAELDGTELERSANVFDLSYVPDDMSFDDDFRDEATPTTESTNTTYKGLDFSTDALRHSKVTLKWDEDDPERSKVTRRALSRKEIEEGDYRAYIASSSSEDEDADDDDIEKSKNEKSRSERERLRKLLLGDDGTGDFPDSNPFSDGDNGAEGDMEITFLPGLSEANAKSQDETTIEMYKRKQKEKRQARKKEKMEKMNEQKDVNGKAGKAVDGDEFFAAGSEGEDNEDEDEVELSKNKKSKSSKSKSKSRRGQEDESEENTEVRPATEAELELLVAPDDTSTARNHFDMKSILKAEKAKGNKKKKNKKNGKKGTTGDGEDDVQEDFQIDVKDDRFKALHEDHTFAIDPSNPHFKKTKSMSALLEERAKRQSVKGGRPEEERLSRTDGPGTQQSLQSLVDSVKRKSSHAGGKGVGKRRRL